MTPFYYANRLPPDRFVGRRLERERLLGLIADNGQSAAIIGEPRVGRSSLLRLLATPATQAEMQRRSPDRRLLFREIEGETLAAGFTGAKFWAHVFEPLAEDGLFRGAGKPLAARYLACVKNAFDGGPLGLLLGRLDDAKIRLVLLVDQLDYLLERHLAGHPDFFAGLRSLTQQGALVLVFTSCLPLSRLNDVASVASRKGSPFFNTFHEILLGPLSTEEIDDVLRPASPRFSPEDRAFAHEASGGYPHLVQAAAEALWSAHEAGRSGADVRREASRELARITEQTLTDTWRRWPPRTRYVVAAIGAAHLEAMGDAARWPSPGSVAADAFEADVAIFGQELHALERHGFISIQGAYRIRPIAFLSWLAVQLRTKSQSAALWSSWLNEEGWDAILSASRRDAWQHLLRAGVIAVSTQLESLLAANAALASADPSARRPAPSQATRPPHPVRIFHSYAAIDEPHRRKLEGHLAALHRERLIETWSGHDVGAGQDWRAEIDAGIGQADIILLHLSADYLASDHCFGVELKHARARHEAGRARVIPILVRPVNLGRLWFTSLDAFPGDARAVTVWPNPDEAWVDVAAAIRRAVEEIVEIGA